MARSCRRAVAEHAVVEHAQRPARMPTAEIPDEIVYLGVADVVGRQLCGGEERPAPSLAASPSSWKPRSTMALSAYTAQPSTNDPDRSAARRRARSDKALGVLDLEHVARHRLVDHEVVHHVAVVLTVRRRDALLGPSGRCRPRHEQGSTPSPGGRRRRSPGHLGFLVRCGHREWRCRANTTLALLAGAHIISQPRREIRGSTKGGWPVTDTETTAKLVFEPPGPGSWAQDPVHLPRPVTRYWAETHPEPCKRARTIWRVITGCSSTASRWRT